MNSWGISIHFASLSYSRVRKASNSSGLVSTIANEESEFMPQFGLDANLADADLFQIYGG